MGRFQAEGMAEAVSDGLIDRELMLRWHLQSNHYPPIPLIMLPVAKEAIEKAEAEEWDFAITMPEGVRYRGRTEATVGAIIEALHLDSFLEIDEG